MFTSSLSMNTRTGRNSETDLCACAGQKKKTVNPVIFNLLCLHENASERDDILFCGPLIFLAAKQNSISSFLQSNSKSELLFWSFFRSGLKGSEWFRGFKISRFIQLKGFLSQLNKSNQQAWGSFHSRRWERRAGLRSVSLNTHNRFILLVRTSKLIVRSGWSLV